MYKDYPEFEIFCVLHEATRNVLLKSLKGRRMPARKVIVKAEPVGVHCCEMKSQVLVSASLPLKKMSGEFDEDEFQAGGDEIFSVCDGSHENDESPTSEEIGEYELNYLHNLYQQTDILSSSCGAFTILPEAPPSLPLNLLIADAAHGALSSVGSNDHAASGQSTLTEVGDKTGSQPDTPPSHVVTSHWAAANAARAQSVVMVSQPQKNSKGSGRKRKGEVNSRPTTPRNHRAVKSESCDKDSNDSSSERGQSPCPSLTHSSEVFEIRPEDDPHGLFGRDPSTLTLEEQRLVKKQRRLLKNRESAQLSRHRKKMHLNALEKQVDVLKKERAALSSRVQELFEENDRLKKQILSSM